MRRSLGFLLLLVGALALSRPAHAGWPGLVDYQKEMRQKGSAVFADPSLRGGTLKRFGPNIITHPGATSAVFSVTDANGKQWAVRCFTRKPPHDRHEAIVRAINESGLGARGTGLFPEIEYLKDGIEMPADGKTAKYPVVKMAWVTGKKLDAHVESLVAAGDHQKLDQLAEDFRAVHGAMRAKKMAHGDLQHGNILVNATGKLELIDFDDLYIDAFKGQKSGGAGHPAYAHPLRGDDFHLDVDNFSSLVVYLSLKAVAHDPSLWKDPAIHIADGNGGGDNLIFQQHDFVDPAASRVFAKLARNPSLDVRHLAAQLARYASENLADVPALDHIVGPPTGKLEPIVEAARPAARERQAPKKTAPVAHVRAASVSVRAASAPAVSVATAHPIASAVSAAASLPEPGPGASATDWMSYRMQLLKRKN